MASVINQLLWIWRKIGKNEKKNQEFFLFCGKTSVNREENHIKKSFAAFYSLMSCEGLGEVGNATIFLIASGLGSGRRTWGLRL